MKLFYSATLALLMSSMPLSCLICKAATEVPCFIFSGNAENAHSIDLASLNKITFGDESMIISSSKDETEQSIELLYSLYHHLEIGNAVPTNMVTAINEVDLVSDTRIYVDTEPKLLYLQTTTDSEFYIVIFNVGGNRLLTSKLSDGDAVSLEFLKPGVYIVVASDGKNKLSHKFILN